MENIITTIIASSLVSTLVAFFFKEWIKQSIKNEYDLKLEGFKVEINKLKEQDNFKFTKLHEKRFKILQKLYDKLSHALHQLDVYTHPIKHAPYGTTPDQYEDGLEEHYYEAQKKFIIYFNQNRLYLNDKMIELMDAYLKESNNIYIKYSQKHHLIKENIQPTNAENQEAYSVNEKIKPLLYPIKHEIEKSFREVLGYD